MDRQAKVYGSVIFLLVVLYILSANLDIAGLEDLFYAAVAVSVIGIAGKVLKEKKIAEIFREHGKNSTGLNYNIDDCKDIAKDWAKSNYSGRIKQKKGLSFDWTQASSDAVPVFDFSSDNWIYVRYFYTQYGPKNKGTLIFVDATNGTVLSPQPVKWKEVKEEPFEELGMYRQTKRFYRRINTGENENNQPAIVSGIPVSNGYYPSPEDGGG